jgi:hypothetical protein
MLNHSWQVPKLLGFVAAVGVNKGQCVIIKTVLLATLCSAEMAADGSQDQVLMWNRLFMDVWYSTGI